MCILLYLRKKILTKRNLFFEFIISLFTKLLPKGYNLTFRSLKELPTTLSELKLIAAPAIIGLSSIPKNGYKIPAAMGTPKVL